MLARGSSTLPPHYAKVFTTKTQQQQNKTFKKYFKNKKGMLANACPRLFHTAYTLQQQHNF